MPIENERKYVIKKRHNRTTGRYPNLTCHFITQGYLNSDARIRRIITDHNVPAAFFTYKKRVFDQLVEIETAISLKDYDLLKMIATGTVEKVRYKYPNGDEHWDIDYLYSGTNQYFAMAEVEMPEGRDEPLEIPDFLKSQIIYPVPRHQETWFTNHKLSSVIYAEGVYRSISNGEIPEIFL